MTDCVEKTTITTFVTKSPEWVWWVHSGLSVVALALIITLLVALLVPFLKRRQDGDV